METAICTSEGNPAPPPREGGLETGLVLGAPTPVRGGGASSGDHPACGAQAACKLVHHHAVGWGRRPRLHTLGFVPVFPTEGCVDAETVPDPGSHTHPGREMGLHCSLLLPPDETLRSQGSCREAAEPRRFIPRSLWCPKISNGLTSATSPGKHPLLHPLCESLLTQEGLCFHRDHQRTLCFHRGWRTISPTAPTIAYSNTARRTQTTVLRRNRSRGLKQGKAENSPQDGSAGKRMATAPHLLEVTLRVFADGRFAGDDTVVATAVLARIRLPNCVILQIKVSWKLDPPSTRRVLFYTTAIGSNRSTETDWKRRVCSSPALVLGVQRLHTRSSKTGKRPAPVARSPTGHNPREPPGDDSTSGKRSFPDGTGSATQP